MTSVISDLMQRSRSLANAPERFPGGRKPSRLGSVPLLTFTAGVGLLIVSIANAIARSSFDDPMLLYWAGVLIIALPIFYRLTSRTASDGERLALVCTLGLALYGVKVARDIPVFTFSDELVHAFNAEQIAGHHELFRENPILSVTPYYPGLEGATSALMTMTGLSSFVSGIVVVGTARLVLVIALFLLFRRLSGSGRVAGIGVVIYDANFNFLFWGAQFSYESLSLPLLAVLMVALAEREAAPRTAWRAWSVPIVAVLAAIVVTHHLTSYAAVAVIGALAVVHRYTRGSWSAPNPWPFAAIGAGLVLAWLVFVASETVGYLSPVITDAIDATISTAFGEDSPRALFQGSESPTAVATPTAARAVALLAVLVLAATLPFGLRVVWRRFRRQPFALLFAAASIAFFGTLAMRLAPAAWETGNRASGFLFVGLAFVVACVMLARWPPLRGRAVGRLAPAAALGVVVIGGAIAGWPWDSHLATPVKVSAEGRTIVSQPYGLARWAARHAPEGSFAASTADARFLLVPGDRRAIAGRFPDVEDILLDPTLADWHLPLLRENDIRYVVTDRRRDSRDGLRGYYFTERGSPADRQLLPRGVATKFGKVPGAARVYASGAIVVYDLGWPRR